MTMTKTSTFLAIRPRDEVVLNVGRSDYKASFAGAEDGVVVIDCHDDVVKSLSDQGRIVGVRMVLELDIRGEDPDQC